MNRYTKIDLGTFEISSNRVVVGDPQLPFSDEGHAIIENVRPGTYRAFYHIINDVAEGERVALLTAVHNSVATKTMKGLTHEIFPTEISINRASGIFDAAHYWDDFAIVNDPKPFLGIPISDTLGERWKAACEEHTIMQTKNAGLIPYGCVGNAAFSSGDYWCYTAKDKAGQVVCISADYYMDYEINAQVGIGPLPWYIIERIHKAIRTNQYEIRERLNGTTPDGEIHPTLHVYFPQLNKTLWFIGGEAGCVIATKNFVAKDYNEEWDNPIVLVVGYDFDSPDSQNMKPWRPLFDVLFDVTMECFKKHGRDLKVLPAWISKAATAKLLDDYKLEMTAEGHDYIIFAPDGSVRFEQQPED